MCTVFPRACLIAALASVLAAPAPASAQVPTQAPVSVTSALVMRISADDAVRLAAENNLGIRVEQFNPQIRDLSILQAEGAWAPALTGSVLARSSRNPSNSFLSGAVGDSTTERSTSSTVQIQQTVPWGANYTVGWDGARTTSNSLFTSFSPQIRSSASLSYSQQLMRGLFVDGTRQQVKTNQKLREIADVQLRQTIATTSRTVRFAYWDLVYAMASLRVAEQSLGLAQEQLRNTRARIEIGTTPPIDEISPQREVASREEDVITARAQIETAEDTLRTLIFKTDDPDFWSIQIEPLDRPEFQAATIDTDSAVRNALEHRTDLAQARKQLEADDINIRYLRDQTRPELTASVDYGLVGLGGTQLLRDAGIGLTPGAVVDEAQRGFGSVLGDLFTNQNPTWTTSVRLSIPLGRSSQESSLASARLQYRQAQTQLKSQEVQVVTQVRQAARQLQTSRKRVDTTRNARELSERSLDAEQRKLAAGTSEQYLVLQAQRDLATARNQELRAILDYVQSVIDLETVQEVPIR